MPRFWPGYLAVWAAILLHVVWVGLLLVPGTKAYNATPVHEVYSVTGYSVWRTAAMFALVAAAALAGLAGASTAGEKVFYLLPQQLVLGISAAGSTVAVWRSHYADGVPRPATFIAGDQLAVILTWGGHTCALMMLYLIHTRRLTFGGGALPSDDEQQRA